MQTLSIKIAGMSCGGCVASVRSALKEVRGVESADVSLENKEAIIIYDDALTDSDQLRSAIERAGYSVPA